jgi:hypothetical protein
MPDPRTNFKVLTDEEFRTTFLQSSQGGTRDADNFFGRFMYLQELLQGNYSRALDQGIELMNKCRSVDMQVYEQIHKGTPFYWLGTAAYLVHDYETATFFYDAAVSEDLRAGANPENNATPALRFIQIEGDPPEQAARPLVLNTQARTEEIIDNYNQRTGKPAGFPALSIADVRARFLRPAVSLGHANWRTLGTTYISFLLEWDYRNMLLDLWSGPGTMEPFLTHLFKGCVLFESLLKENSNHPVPHNIHASTLRQVLNHLRPHLGFANDFQIGNTDLPSIIQDIPQADDSIRTAIEFTGRIRNTAGHNLSWQVQINKIQYSILFRL